MSALLPIEARIFDGDEDAAYVLSVNATERHSSLP